MVMGCLVLHYRSCVFLTRSWEEGLISIGLKGRQVDWMGHVCSLMEGDVVADDLMAAVVCLVVGLVGSL